MLGRAPVLLGLAMTVLGYAGVFAVFTYIAPLLTEITGFSRSRRVADPAGLRRRAGRSATCSAASWPTAR